MFQCCSPLDLAATEVAKASPAAVDPASPLYPFDDITVGTAPSLTAFGG